MSKRISKWTARPDKEGGYMLILAVLITSIALAISLTLFSITLKEFLLSSFIRESGRAFTAADAGLECALFWDRGYKVAGLSFPMFATSSVGVPSGPSLGTQAEERFPDDGVADCGGVNILDTTAFTSANGYPAGWTEVAPSVTQANTMFNLRIPNADNSVPCDMYAFVTIAKKDGDTTISSEGFNSCVATNRFRTGRTLEIRTNI